MKELIKIGSINTFIVFLRFMLIVLTLTILMGIAFYLIDLPFFAVAIFIALIFAYLLSINMLFKKENFKSMNGKIAKIRNVNLFFKKHCIITVNEQEFVTLGFGENFPRIAQDISFNYVTLPKLVRGNVVPSGFVVNLLCGGKNPISANSLEFPGNSMCSFISIFLLSGLIVIPFLGLVTYLFESKPVLYFCLLVADIFLICFTFINGLYFFIEYQNNLSMLKKGQ